jgi:GT2 family glycosyltransferase
MRPPVSVVIISRDEGIQLRRTVENIEETLPPGGEILVVDDGSVDGSTRFLARKPHVSLYRGKDLGVARARNLGAGRAKGGILVFADGHIRAEAGWFDALAAILDDPGVAAAAPAVTNLGGTMKRGYGLTFTGPDLDVRWLDPARRAPYPALILPGCFLAIRRATLRALGGWDSGLRHRGGVDNELCVRAWLLGYRLAVTPETEARHKFRVHAPFPVGWAEYIHNHLRLAFAHFKPERLGKTVSALSSQPEFGGAVAMIAESEITARRQRMLAIRKRSDDWLFERFGLPW